MPVEKLESGQFTGYHMGRKLNEIIDLLNQLTKGREDATRDSKTNQHTDAGNHTGSGEVLCDTGVEFTVTDKVPTDSEGKARCDVPVSAADKEQLPPDSESV